MNTFGFCCETNTDASCVTSSSLSFKLTQRVDWNLRRIALYIVRYAEIITTTPTSTQTTTASTTMTTTPSTTETEQAAGGSNNNNNNNNNGGGSSAGGRPTLCSDVINSPEWLCDEYNDCKVGLVDGDRTNDERDAWCYGQFNLPADIRPPLCSEVLENPSLMCDGGGDCPSGEDEHDGWCNPARRSSRARQQRSDNDADSKEEGKVPTMSPRVECLSCHPNRVLVGGRYVQQKAKRI